MDPINGKLEHMLSEVDNVYKKMESQATNLHYCTFAHISRMSKALNKPSLHEKEQIWSSFKDMGKLHLSDYPPQVRFVPIDKNLDPVCELPKDLLSLLVYCFFPTSHAHFDSFNKSYRLNSQYVVMNRELGRESIVTGSEPEYLWLPPVRVRDTVKTIMDIELGPDFDQMINYTLTNRLYKNMLVEIDETRPVF